MKTFANLLAGLACLFFMVGCSPSVNDELFSNTVAKRMTVDKDKVVVADFTAFKDTVILPLSYLAEDLEMIRLDNSDKALFKYGHVFLSENYIGMLCYQPSSFKLFDRKTGKYLRDIGTRGNGPGEYHNIYSAQIDENAGNIYILPWQATQLLVFGIDGSLKEPIPFPASTEKHRYEAPKGQFHVSDDGILSMTVLPFYPIYAWQQDLKGNLLVALEKPESMGRINYSQMNFSSEVVVGKNTGAFDPFLMIFDNQSNDMLAHFCLEEKRMVPVFTVKNIQNILPPYYSYYELPKHFTGYYIPGMVPVEDSPNTRVGQAPRYFIIDKESLKGAYYKLVIDDFGNMPVEGDALVFREGYYIGNMAAELVKTQIASLLEKGGLTEPMAKKLKDFDAQFDEEDNNIVFLAKLKQ